MEKEEKALIARAEELLAKMLQIEKQVGLNRSSNTPHLDQKKARAYRFAKTYEADTENYGLGDITITTPDDFILYFECIFNASIVEFPYGNDFGLVRFERNRGVWRYNEQEQIVHDASIVPNVPNVPKDVPKKSKTLNPQNNG